MRPKQQTLASSGFKRYRKRTRSEQFLADMNQVVPWGALVELIAPVYPKGQGAGRPPVVLERMLRIHCLQHWFNLSDPAVEETLYDSRAVLEFVSIDLGREPVPDETTICKFRHLLEAHERGPQMHQTKKGNEWHSGMKAHVGSSRHKLIHSVAATAANVHDSHLLPELQHSEETVVLGDSACQGKGEVIHTLASRARDMTHGRYGRGGWLDPVERRENRSKSRVRTKVEYSFLVLKVIFSFRKVRYRGIAKNAQRLKVACALVNLFMLPRPLLRLA